jgi:phage terminase large subunit-like protein
MGARKRQVVTPSRADNVIDFIGEYCRCPEGMHIGKPIELDGFQREFIHAVYDNPDGTRRGILSTAKKNGKTSLVAALALAHVVGPEAIPNSQVVSGAMAREQAALVHGAMAKMIELEPRLARRAHIVPTGKRIIGLTANVEYRALAAKGSTTQGISPVLALLDEVGQVVGPSDPFFNAVLTSQGAYARPLALVISTQAPSDADMLSLMIDDALRSGDPHVVCHLYAAPEGCDLLDRAGWAAANPGLGSFRDLDDLRVQLTEASRLPSKEASARNLLLNQRIALEKLWIVPSIWRKAAGDVDLALFRDDDRRVAVGLDLSARHDLTAAVAAVRDDAGRVHLLPHAFTPIANLRERSEAQRVPLLDWVRDGHVVGVPGATVDYEYVAEWLAREYDRLGIEPHYVGFDRWRIDIMVRAADAKGWAQGAQWEGVGQGFLSMTPRVECFESLLLAGNIVHPNAPPLNMATASAIVVNDPAGNRKLDKARSTQKIDPLIAALMAAFAVSDGAPSAVDVDSWVG